MKREIVVFVGLIFLAVVCLSFSSVFAQEEITVELPGEATMEFVWIEPGTFTMGTTEGQKQLLQSKGMWDGWFENELPEHQVTISQGFYLGKFEITQDQWERVMDTTPWSGQSYVQENPDHPAVYISWYDVQAFILQLNEAAGDLLFRLPTEAEWEYACRGGTTTLWSFGDDESQLDEYAWVGGYPYAQAVGTKLPNPWGLYDMHGNVWELVQDRWYREYTTEAQVDPTGPETGSERVSRGGNFDVPGKYSRSAHRSNAVPSRRVNSVGARLVMQKLNQPPDVGNAAPSKAEIWPPNNKMVDITIEGIVDPDGDAVTIMITGITDDEGSDPTDVGGIGTSTAQVRAQRDGKGNGRVYTISFTASDGQGGEASGAVEVTVPHDQGNGKKKGRGKPVVGNESTSWGAIKESVK